MSDRTKLEEAIRDMRNWDFGGEATRAALDVTLAAAEAHLATLPETKTVEVWHIHYARLQQEGYWAALVEGSFMSRISAEREAGRLANDSKNANVSVTGPHQQEVPA